MAKLMHHKLKPWAHARRGVGLARREVVAVTRAFEEELFAAAEVLSEGSCRHGAAGRADSYFGSTMISVDLDRLRPWLRGGLDARGQRELANALQGSVRVHLRAMRMARAEARRRVPDRLLGTAYVETKVRVTERHLHIDVDLEVALSVSSGSGTR
jgi:hypothetical protein